MKIKEKIKALQTEMINEKVDVYYVTTSDFHQSEYISDYFKVREFLTGFTGSRGTLVVTQKEAVLWVDGRYFTQADRELKGSGIRALKMGQPKVPTLVEYLTKEIPENGVLGFDGTVVNAATSALFKKILGPKKSKMKTKDLVGPLWIDRPALPSGECFLLPDKYTGVKAEKKITRL